MFRIAIIIFALTITNYAQSLNGLAGHLNIPSAETSNDRTIFVGANYMHRHGVNYSNHRYDLANYYITAVYLPNLEISLRINVLQGVSGDYTKYTWDRMFSFKYRFIKENNIIPSIAIGFHNPYSTGSVEDASHHFNSTYIAATKNISGIPLINILKITAGYGDDFIRSDDYQYIGFFGGVSAQFNLDKEGRSNIEYIIEYDAERFNTGLRIKLFEHLSLLGGFLSLKYPCGGASVSFSL